MLAEAIRVLQVKSYIFEWLMQGKKTSLFVPIKDLNACLWLKCVFMKNHTTWTVCSKLFLLYEPNQFFYVS